MADKRTARIIVTSGKHANLQPEVGVYEPGTGKYTQLGQTGLGKPMQEERVRKMKEQLERAGNTVEVIER